MYNIVNTLLQLIIIAMIIKTVHLLFKLKKRICMDNQQLLAALQDAKAEADKAKTEIIQKISDLETAISNGGQTTPEIDQALSDLKDSIKGVDDIVPDVE